MIHIDPALLDRLAALDAALRAAGYLGESPAPIEALSFDPPSTAIPTWRAASGSAAQAVIDGWDWTPRSEAERSATATIHAIRTAADPVSRGTRATVTLLFMWLNDLREQSGLPRYTEDEILAAIAAGALVGAGEPR